MAAPLSIARIELLINQNPLMAGAIGIAILGGLAYFIYRKYGDKSPSHSQPEIDVPDYTSLDQKTNNEFNAYMKKDGWDINQPIHHKSQKKGVATRMFEKKVPAGDVLSYKEEKDWSDGEEDEDEPKMVYMNFYKVKSGSRVQKVSDWFNNLVGRETSEHYRVVRKDFVDENGLGIHIDNDTDFTHFGGIMIEDTVEGRNAVIEVPMSKALEKHVNDKDEYAKKTDHMDREHSKQMGRFEKEIEADERAYGNKLANR